MGLFWRFSAGGRLAAGEKIERTAEVNDQEWKEQLEAAHTSDGYQFYAGSFMSVYLWMWLVVIIIGLSVLGLYGIKYWLEADERAKLRQMEENEKLALKFEEDERLLRAELEKEYPSDHFDFNHADEPQTSNQELPPLNLDQQAVAATILDAAA